MTPVSIDATAFRGFVVHNRNLTYSVGFMTSKVHVWRTQHFVTRPSCVTIRELDVSESTNSDIVLALLKKGSLILFIVYTTTLDYPHHCVNHNKYEREWKHYGGGTLGACICSWTNSNKCRPALLDTLFPNGWSMQQVSSPSTSQRDSLFVNLAKLLILFPTHKSLRFIRRGRKRPSY